MVRLLLIHSRFVCKHEYILAQEFLLNDRKEFVEHNHGLEATSLIWCTMELLPKLVRKSGMSLRILDLYGYSSLDDGDLGLISRNMENLIEITLPDNVAGKTV